jgi:hypothetical protein
VTGAIQKHSHTQARGLGEVNKGWLLFEQLAIKHNTQSKILHKDHTHTYTLTREMESTRDRRRATTVKCVYVVLKQTSNLKGLTLVFCPRVYTKENSRRKLTILLQALKSAC